MIQEKTLSVSSTSHYFIVNWETISNSIRRCYSRTFQTFKELNTFIRQNPNRGYYLIREDVCWSEKRENFMGFDVIGTVRCATTVKIFDITDFDLLPF